MAYDRDLSTVYTRNNVGTLTQVSVGTVALVNSETDQSSPMGNMGGSGWYAVLFPEPRDIIGYYARAGSVGSGSAGAVQVSTDTTNSVDGTWSQVAANWGTQGASNTFMRTNIVSISPTSVVGIRFLRTSSTGNFDLANLHLYGNKSSAGDYLEFWHPTLDQRYGTVDAGDVPRNSTATFQFRLKNRSASLTAGTITIADDVPTNQTPDVDTQWVLSTDNSTFTESVSVTSLAPGAISSTLYVKRITSQTSILGLRALRLNASAASWT
jgi:hypothetical protein